MTDPFPAQFPRFRDLMVSCDGNTATKRGMPGSGEVVEIGLLLPSAWADALLEMSKRRRQSVATILRNMIDRALLDETAAQP